MRRRTVNPVFLDKTLKDVEAVEPGTGMTLDGVINKSFMLLILCVVATSVVWDSNLAEGPDVWTYMFGGVIVSMMIGSIAIFKKPWSPFVAPLYAVGKGVTLGVVSLKVEAEFPGTMVNAVLFTFGAFAVVLFAYKLKLVRANEYFKMGLVTAIGGTILVYVFSALTGGIGRQVPFPHESGFVGILVSLVVVALVAFHLVVDFNSIEDGVKKSAPKYMESYSAFGLLFTLIYLYFGLLRFILKVYVRK